MVIPAAVNVSVSEALMALGVVRAADHRKVPLVLAVQNEMLLIVSVAVPVKTGLPDRLIVPPETVKLNATRVDALATFEVPAAPGSPMWSCPKMVVRAVAAVAPEPWTEPSQRAATFAEERPTAIYSSSSVVAGVTTASAKKVTWNTFSSGVISESW